MLQKSLYSLSMPRFRLDYATSGNQGVGGSVLVALDGGCAAERALPVAQALTAHWKAPLRLVHVRNPVEDAQRMDVRLVDNQDSLAVQTRAGAYLKDLSESLREATGRTVTWEAIAGVSVTETLRTLCEKDARVLVMARSRRTLLSRFWWGSVTDRLVGRLATPLVVVPETETPASSAEALSEGGFSRVLVYIDGSDAAGLVVDSAAAISATHAVCHLLRVLPLSSFYATGRGRLHGSLDVRSQAWRELAAARATLEQRGLVCKSRLIFDGQAAGAAILDQARAMRAELIVLAARPRMLPWWLRDGVAEHVVRHTSVPVLVVPAEGKQLSQTRSNHVDFHSN